MNIANILNDIKKYTTSNDFDKVKETTLKVEKNIFDNYKTEYDFKRLIDSIIQYSDYSFFNSLLIDYQYPDFLDLNTKQKYLRNGFDIKNPEKAIRILSPNNDVYVKIKNDDKEEIKLVNNLTKEELKAFNDPKDLSVVFNHKELKGLNILELFDCKDTTMSLKDYKHYNYPVLLNSSYNEIYDSFVKAIYSMGYKVKYIKDINQKYSFDSKSKTININKNINSKSKILSMLEIYSNELTSDSFNKDLIKYVICKGIGIENDFEEKYSFLDWYKKSDIKNVDYTFKLISSNGKKFINQFNKFYQLEKEKRMSSNINMYEQCEMKF